jgi:hypothetical protein
MATFVTYTPADVKFAVSSSENLRIATAQYLDTSVYNSDVLYDVVEPVTFAHGLISLTNGSVSVAGQDTEFERDFKAGQFLYYYNNQGDPVLAGRISTISNDTTLTLTDQFAGSSVVDANCGMTTNIFLSNSDFIVRIPTQLINNGSNMILPNWGVYKSTNGQSNNSANMGLNRYSLVNSPETAASPPLANVPFQIRAFGRQNWEYEGADKLYFGSFPDFAPKYAFAVLSIYSGTTQNLSSNTLYKFLFNSNVQNNGIVVGVQSPGQDLIDAQYDA